MKHPFRYMWSHPRRTGFLVFNVIVIVLLIAWGAFTANMSEGGISALPNLMLGYTGMALLAVAWIVGWIAWGYMVVNRHAHHQHPPAP